MLGGLTRFLGKCDQKYRIKNILNQTDKKEFESKKFSEYKDQFQWFLAIGLLFLFIEVFLFDTKTFWLKKLNLFNEN